MSAEQIDVACSHLDGYEGVLADRAFTIGHEALGRFLQTSLDGPARRTFLERFREELYRDPGSQCYFVESFIDGVEIDDDLRRTMILAAPASYQVHLERLNFGSV
ncbi:hypothetical protein shim_30470 [Shimia sp. SK013]|nr:hypothetical protein shim_30470 [Shimia sp. SK013]